MPSSYRPRPAELKQCEHCELSFESRHQRTRFCSNSCRTRAFYARHGRQLPELPKAVSESVEINPSWNNVAVIAGSVAALDLTKHLLTQPSQPTDIVADLIQEIRALRQNNKVLKDQLNQIKSEETERQQSLAKIAGR
ncbi:MAG: CGNR zinc finger domain-containing protein [Hymenobacter sp.]|nr:MAG: CGNR zinc finger domain-containing protein [Hymenobacter sp.]